MKNAPTNAARSAHGKRLHGAPPKCAIKPLAQLSLDSTQSAIRKTPANKTKTASTVRLKATKRPHRDHPEDQDKTTAQSKPKRMKRNHDMPDALSKPDAADILQHLVERASPRQVRARLGEGCLPNIFEDAKEGKFGRVRGQTGGHGKLVRRMFWRMVRHTRDGQCTAANAEYFLQILEEMERGQVDGVLALAEEVFKLLLIVVSYRKPPPESFGSAAVVMTKKQVLHIVGSELREAIREVENRE